MATTAGTGAANFTVIVVTPPPHTLIAPRWLTTLGFQDNIRFGLWFDFVHRLNDKELSPDESVRKAETLGNMTEEQKRTFPILAEEIVIYVALERAEALRESLKELAHGLSLEAENEIDRSRDRC